VKKNRDQEEVDENLEYGNEEAESQTLGKAKKTSTVKPIKIAATPAKTPRRRGRPSKNPAQLEVEQEAPGAANDVPRASRSRHPNASKGKSVDVPKTSKIGESDRDGDVDDDLEEGEEQKKPGRKPRKESTRGRGRGKKD
jgi:hypothetical protein